MAHPPVESGFKIHRTAGTSLVHTFLNVFLDEKIKAWKLQDSKDKTGGLRYDPSTGEVIIAVSGYYYVYAQVISGAYPEHKIFF